MLKNLLPIALLSFWCCCTPARISKPFVSEPANDAPRPVSSIYHVTADAKPESLLVHAEVDIDFQNLSSDTLRTLALVQSLNTGTERPAKVQFSRIDNLLLDGASVSVAATYSDSPIIRLVLPSPLKRGERAALSFSLVAKVAPAGRSIYGASECTRFADWLPRVTGWSTPPTRQFSMQAGPADFDVSLTVDSGLFVVASGELLNDKELLGMVPNVDTIMADVINKPYAADGYVFSRLPSKNGKDTYVWRDRFNRGFDFLVLNGYLLDRGRKGDFAVESYYPQELAAVWKHQLVAKDLDYLRSAPLPIGALPDRPLRLVIAGERSSRFSSAIQLLSTELKKPKFLPPQEAR